MCKLTNFATLVIVVQFFTQVLLLPLDAPESAPHGRKGRCFQSIWNYFQGGTQKYIDENIISNDPDLIRFFLYPEPSNPDYFQEIVYNDVQSLQIAKYKFAAPWKILIHGYTMSQFGQFPQNVKNGYLEEYMNDMTKDQNAEGFNVLVVDWGPLADPKLSRGNLHFLLLYSFAVKNVKTVGIRVGEFLQFLRRNGALQNYDKAHIIGFSLGAHCAGNAGSTILNMTGEKVGRITGLDPAGPNFYLELKTISSPKLSKANAKFVDVYHSNQGQFGTLSKLGHVDHYINGGGPNQPSCLELYTKAENSSVADLGSCSHNAGPRFFAKSITSQPRLIACQCDSFDDFKNGCDCVANVMFGEYCPPQARGSYYIDMADTLPSLVF